MRVGDRRDGGTAEDAARHAVRAAVEGELRLLDPAVRAEPERVLELLDPEFSEFGASGRRWDRHTVLAALLPDGGGETQAVTATDMAGTPLGPGLVHLTYVSERDGRRVLRSSLWRASEGVWRLWFHQGTPAAPSGP